MSPQNKKKLNSLRKQLDKLDNDLLGVFKKRSSIIKQVLALKEYKKQIVDKKRINKILSNIKNSYHFRLKYKSLKKTKIS